MNITIDKKPNCEAELHIEMDAAAVGERRKKIIQRYQQGARVQGFRPGKAPIPVIEKKFAREIDGELREALVGDGCREAAATHKISVISVRAVRNDTFQPDGNFTFTADLTLEPDISLPEYKGIEVKAPKADVPDALFDARMLELRRQFTTYNDITDRPLQNGDNAIIDFTGAIGGVPVEELDPASPILLRGSNAYWVRMEEDGFLPGFTAQIDGMAVGERRDVTSVVPEDYPSAALAGKEIIFAVTLKGNKEAVMPEVDDAFAARLLPGKSLEDLLQVFRQRLMDEVIERRRTLIVQQILEFLDKSIVTELPSELIQNETQQRVDQMVDRGLSQGLENEDIEAQQEQIFSTAAEQARVNVKTTLVLEQIARKEKLVVTDQELVNRIAYIAQRNNKPLKKFIGELKRQNAIPGMRAHMLVGKAIDFLVLNAKVSEAGEEAGA